MDIQQALELLRRWGLRQQVPNEVVIEGVSRPLVFEFFERSDEVGLSGYAVGWAMPRSRLTIINPIDELRNIARPTIWVGHPKHIFSDWKPEGASSASAAAARINRTLWGWLGGNFQSTTTRSEFEIDLANPLYHFVIRKCLLESNQDSDDPVVPQLPNVGTAVLPQSLIGNTA